MLKEYLEFRNKCLDELTEGTLSKESFITTMFDFFNDHNLSAIKNVTSFDEALYNYQYYNVRAKMDMMEFKDYEMRDLQYALSCRDRAFEDYRQKDIMILKMLDLEGYEHVKGFFIKMNSVDLEGELFEVVFTDKERVIFHTKDRRILRRLRNNNCFNEELQESLISEYVNKSW